ncbi:collagen-like protein [Helicobacter pylori]|nr:collagen-like protein [Helicobacter pylori]
MKKKSNVFKILMSLCLVTSISHALVIQTMQDWNLRKNSEFKAFVVVGNKVQENTLAMGHYKVSKNRANLSISVTHIKKGNDYKTLQSPPNAIKEIKGRLVLKKGTRIVLGGENDSEMSNAIGVSKSTYTSSKNGKGFSGSGTSGMGYASGYGVTGNTSSNGSGVSSTSTNGIARSDGSSGANGSNGANGIDGTSGVNGANGTSGANGNNSANGGAASADSHYTNEFCTAPIRNGNTMSLDIVDRNGSCFKMQAFRNDNVCQYSYDFENMKAIKQTQFYFINRENKSVNIGGCVDLYGKQFEFTMYEDANKCKLDTTTDKGYGSGSASFFQTEILFRGLDNLIHVAKSCTDFAGVQEQLVKYDNDPATRTVQRVVNQYYIDPITKQKVFISHNVVSPLKFSYQTYACGKWQFDDAKLEAYRPTQIRIFDTVANQYYNVTGCDYTSDMGKVPKIVQPYTKINVASSVKGEEVGDLDTTNGSNDHLPQYTTFEIQEMSLNSSQWTTTSYCNDFWGSWTKTYGYTGYSQGNLRTLAKWVTQYKTINQGTTIEYIRPRNEGDSDAVYDTYKYYYVSQAQKTLQRIPLTIYINSLNLSEEYRKNFELTTLSQELNLNNSVKQLINTQDFTNWKATYYRPNGNGNLCMSYSFSSGSPWKSSDKGRYCSWAQTPNANYSCASHNNWIVPNR